MNLIRKHPIAAIVIGFYLYRVYNAFQAGMQAGYGDVGNPLVSALIAGATF